MSRKFLILLVLLIFMGVLLSSQEPIQKRGVKPVVEKKKEENKNQKIALVIGNALYKESPLKNPVNDAIDTAEVLKKCGFEVTLKTNANQLEMEKAVREFSDRLKDGGICLFYFSGHGVQVEGINYLFPVKSNIQDESDVKAKSVSANYILGKMDRRREGMNIMILDACRNNPFARGFRSPSTGLAQMDAPQGSLIVYATSPGKTADDGTGRNGIFTKHLLETIKQTPFEIMVLLRKVRRNVMDETNDKQIPWESSSLLGSFYFFYNDAQLEKIEAEISELQSQIKDHEVQRQEFEKIESKKEEREAARKEEEKKAQLKFKKLKRERLLKEKERQERLKQEEERLAREEAQERTERERQEAAAEERKNQLIKKLAEEEENLKDIKQRVLSIEAAQKEIEGIEGKINNIASLISQEKRKALMQLDEVYSIKILDLRNKPIPPKDHFETTTDYEARIKKDQERIKDMENRYRSEYSDIQDKYANAIESLTKAYKNQIEELRNKKYPVEGLNVELLNYNADKKSYSVRLTDARGKIRYYLLPVKPDIARGLFERKELLRAEGYYAGLNNINRLFEVFVIDQISGRLQLFPPKITLRTYYMSLSPLKSNDAISMIKQKRFFDLKNNAEGDFKNEFVTVRINEDVVVLDFATGLMWHQSGSPRLKKTFFESIWRTDGDGGITHNHINGSVNRRVRKWLKKLNETGYAGYKDWRFPNLEEAASLLDRGSSDSNLYIDKVFSSEQWIIWTGDGEILDKGNLVIWIVDFRRGTIDLFYFNRENKIFPYLRPVRFIQ